MTIDPIYIKIFMIKNYIMNDILIKKNSFFSIQSSYIKKFIFTAASLQVHFLTATQFNFKLIPIQIQMNSYIKQ